MDQRLKEILTGCSDRYRAASDTLPLAAAIRLVDLDIGELANFGIDCGDAVQLLAQVYERELAEVREDCRESAGSAMTSKELHVSGALEAARDRMSR